MLAAEPLKLSATPQQGGMPNISGFVEMPHRSGWVCRTALRLTVRGPSFREARDNCPVRFEGPAVLFCIGAYSLEVNIELLAGLRRLEQVGLVRSAGRMQQSRKVLRL